MTIRFEVVEQLDDATREAWRRWSERSATPFGMPAFFDAWRAAFRADKATFLIVGREDNALRFLAPMWHHRGDPNTWCSLGALRADYTDVLVESDAVAAAFWRWLATRAPCRSAKLPLLPSASPLVRTAPPSSSSRARRLLALARTLARGGRPRFVRTHVHHDHPFADRSFIAEVAPRLQSRDTKRKLNVLKRDGELVYEVVRGARALSPLLPTFFDMHIANFAGTARTSQFLAAHERAFYEQLVAQPELDGIVYMDVLRVGARPVAMHLGFQHRRCVYWYKPAFDLAMAKGSPGRVLLAHLFARAAAEDCERVDLLKGIEPYKSEWANQCHDTSSTTLVELGVSYVLDRLLATTGTMRSPR